MLKCFIGCMFSGKTSAMINEIEKANIAGIKTLIVKWNGDNRYCREDEKRIITHGKKEYQHERIISCDNLDVIDTFIDKEQIQVVGIDEYQFFQGCDYPIKWVKKGIDVYIAALNGDYKQQVFENVAYILPYCDEVLILKAVCMKCFKRNTAIVSHRLSTEIERIIIGSNDKYIALCRGCYFDF